ncbi:hypothetical protein [Streptomyces sp. G45]|uniref:hypothetical protein n=1 Tax=Streptomyces sp. G45 TaxID=3406627 RepID=UPI003C26D1B8
MGWPGWALWGAVGGIAMEALDYIIAVRRWRRMPWAIASTSLAPEAGQTSPAADDPTAPELPAPGVLAYCTAGVLRVGLGVAVAVAVGYSIPKAGVPWLFLVIGAAAPLLLEKLTMLVPLLQAAAQQLQQPVPQSQAPPDVPPPGGGGPAPALRPRATAPDGVTTPPGSPGAVPGGADGEAEPRRAGE